MATRVDNNLILMSHWALWVVLFIALLLRSNVPEQDGWVHSALFQEYDGLGAWVGGWVDGSHD